MKTGIIPNTERQINQFDKTANEIVSRMAQGDEQALGAFSKEFKRYSLAIVYRILGDRQTAEEVYHDALLKLYRNCSKLDLTNRCAMPYYRILLRRTAIDRLRRRKPIVYLEDPTDFAKEGCFESDYKSPADEAETASQIDRLKYEISKLSPSLRKPLEAVYETGESYPKIAENLQLPLGTLKSSIRRGMLILRDIMKTEYNHTSETLSIDDAA